MPAVPSARCGYITPHVCACGDETSITCVQCYPVCARCICVCAAVHGLQYFSSVSTGPPGPCAWASIYAWRCPYNRSLPGRARPSIHLGLNLACVGLSGLVQSCFKSAVHHLQPFQCVSLRILCACSLQQVRLRKWCQSLCVRMFLVALRRRMRLASATLRVCACIYWTICLSACHVLGGRCAPRGPASPQRVLAVYGLNPASVCVMYLCAQHMRARVGGLSHARVWSNRSRVCCCICSCTCARVTIHIRRMQHTIELDSHLLA